MTTAERAKQFVGRGKYKLGKGNGGAGRTTPFADEDEECDCSGYRAYVGEYNRREEMPIEEAKLCNLDYEVIEKQSGKVAEVYWNCANIAADAKGKYHHRYRKVPVTEPVQEGDVVVRGPSPGQAHGHVVGAVTKVAPDFQKFRGGKPGWGKRLTIVHCSSFREAPAIRETNAVVFEKHKDAFIVRQLVTPTTEPLSTPPTGF